VVLAADHVTPMTFIDAAPHRAGLPPFYNQYTRVAADPAYTPTNEGAIALFRPLFATGFLLDDFLARERFFGARDVVLSSASSKTALALAFLLSSGRREQCRVIGLTSASNAAFVRSTGYYAEVFTYDEIAAKLPTDPGVFVDFAGNPRLVEAVHRRLAGALRYSCQVGITHWDHLGPVDGLPGPAPILFFAPDHGAKRVADWGPAEFAARLGRAMERFLGSVAGWLEITVGCGPAAIEAVYRALLEGRTNPACGHVLSL